jgi:hypothetical protein
MGFFKTAGRTMLSLGIDLRRMKSARHIRRFLRDRRLWIAKGGKIDAAFPILGDFDESAGTANGHYFHMDLLVARFIFDAQPKRHLDIGSRIDGFVAHVAAFREVEVMDIRPLSILAHPQIHFVQGDLMRLPSETVTPVDSLSCLHVLEHIGLGRYGDPIDPAGHRHAFANLVNLVSLGGIFYFATPVGQARVMFNAHRVFDPVEVAAWQAEKLELKRFDYVDDAGVLHLDATPSDAAGLEYGCGIFTFARRL